MRTHTDTVIWLFKVIKSCLTPQQVDTAERLLDNYANSRGVEVPPSMHSRLKAKRRQVTESYYPFEV